MTTAIDIDTAAQIAKAVRTGELSARQVAETYLERIEVRNPSLNAFTLVTRRRALEEADRIDALLAAGKDPGPLAGVPYAVKNLFDLQGEVTVAGSKINRDQPPATQDATAARRLQAAGALCVGALNMGEYAYDFITDNPHDGATRNPHDTERSAGGSSGGSGAAVAAGMAPITLGTDTNGSIRVPASFCGIWGLRPTYGALSRAGSFAFVDTLDTIGPFARSPRDLALCFDAMSGPDPLDPTTRFAKPSRCSQLLEADSSHLRIATLGGYFASGGEAFIHQAVEKVAKSLDVDTVLELPEAPRARAAAYLITAAESAARHLERLKSRAADFDPVIRDRLLSGLAIPAAWPHHAQRFRAWWREQLAEIFTTVDVLIAPATPLRAPTFQQDTFPFNGQEIPLRPNIGLFTQPISLIGLPIVAAPVCEPGELPCAVQLIGKPGSEGMLLALAQQLESSGVCRAARIPTDAP